MSEYTMSSPEIQLTLCPPQKIPPGLCQCGCGRETKIVQETNRPRGWIKGEYCRYITGHNRRCPLPTQFWRDVTVGEPVQCWLWQGVYDRKGYGTIRRNGHHLGAHRVAYALMVGPIPDGLCVCHTCDTPHCCNPAHLFLGTQADNMRDCKQKGRNHIPCGSLSPSAKLTEHKVLQIRAEYQPGKITYAGLGKKYHVSKGCIGNIINRKKWRHV